MEQGGIRYDHQVKDGVASLDKDLKLDSEELSKISSQDMVREIEKVREEWFQAFVPLDSDGKIDKKNLAAKLDAALEDRKKAHREYLVRKNGKWIYPSMIKFFRRPDRGDRHSGRSAAETRNPGDPQKIGSRSKENLRHIGNGASRRP